MPSRRRASLALVPVILLLLGAGVAAVFLDVGEDGDAGTAAAPTTTITGPAATATTAATTAAPSATPATTASPAPASTTSTTAATTGAAVGGTTNSTSTMAATTSTTTPRATIDPGPDAPPPGPATRHPATGPRLPVWPAVLTLLIGLLGLRARRRHLVP